MSGGLTYSVIAEEHDGTIREEAKMSLAAEYKNVQSKIG